MDGMQHIRPVVEQMVSLLRPTAVYLYNQKHNPKGELTAFKLCAVASTGDKAAAERQIYRGIDSEIPFDVLLYTPQEWSDLTADADSFASHIAQSGTVVYG